MASPPSDGSQSWDKWGPVATPAPILIPGADLQISEPLRLRRNPLHPGSLASSNQRSDDMADQNRDGGTAGTGDREAATASGSVQRGDGDDRANALGGGEGRGAGMTGGGSATGDAGQMRSEGGGGDGLGGPDAGSPGGMGGVRAAGGTGTDRPPGGLSPVQPDDEDRS
jgi:hypothetical protein